VNWKLYVWVSTSGLLLTLGIAARVDILNDAPLLAGLVILASTAVGIVGWYVLWWLRWRSVRVQVVIVTLVSVVGTVLGVEATAQQMFVSTHDRDVLLVIVSAAGTVGILTALVLGGRVGHASQSVSDLTRQIGEGNGAESLGRRRVVTGEFSELADQLEMMAARLEAARQREHELERSRRELVAWVSHDLRTPLSAIRAMIEAIEDGVVSDQVTIDRYHGNIHTEVDRLSGLVSDLFELSRIHAGALDTTREPVRLLELVSDGLATVQPVANARGIVVSGWVDHPVPVVEGSARELARVIQNLLDNAVAHTPDNGKVIVGLSTDETGCQALIEVSDSGPGVELHRRDVIFDVGHTGDMARSRGGGSGLGLAIARGLAEAHRGSISVSDSPELGGAHFTVQLPLDQTRVVGASESLR